MNTYPFLDIREALADADRNLADIIYYTQVLQADTEGHLPPDAATLLANSDAALYRANLWLRTAIRASAGTCGSREPKTIISRPRMSPARASDPASASAPSAPSCSPVG